MGPDELANDHDKTTLFFWLVEEVGELGKAVYSNGIYGSITDELGDVYNLLLAIAKKLGYTSDDVRQFAKTKGDEYL